MVLGIEDTLEGVGGGFIEKYRLMKDRLLNCEYEHWAAGFPEGNNHGRGHINRVLEYLDYLVGPEPLEHLSVYELFLAMMSILYHDIGLLRQRQGHADISKQLLEDDANDRYIINPIDKEIIAAAVVSHSSSKDIPDECARFSEVEFIGQHRARPTVIASLVRLADELDEDHRRADPVLQGRLHLPQESNFFWLFCQRVRGVRPILVTKQINFNVKFEPIDLGALGPLPGGKIRRFISFAAEKLAKINHERTVLNNFLPPELRYAGLHVDVKPLANHHTWTSPRTFVFNDSTTAEMFLGSFPELHSEPMNIEMQRILELMKKGDLNEAELALDRLESVLSDLPRGLRHRVYYDRACVCSIRAATLTDREVEQTEQLDAALKNLLEWYRLGEESAFAEEGRTANAELYRMVSDGDLAFLLTQRRSELESRIPLSSGPLRRGGGGGCVPLGSLIETPTGRRNVESLRPDDEVLSLRTAKGMSRVGNRIVAVATTRTASLIRLNNRWEVTPMQPVLTRAGWREARSIQCGEEVVDGDGVFVEVTDLSTISAYTEVFDLTLDGPEHNYVANGLLCHNKR